MKFWGSICQAKETEDVWSSHVHERVGSLKGPREDGPGFSLSCFVCTNVSNVLQYNNCLPTFSNFLDLNQGQIRGAVTWGLVTSVLQLRSDPERSSKNPLVPQVHYSPCHTEISLCLRWFNLGVMHCYRIGQMLSGNQDVN